MGLSKCKNIRLVVVLDWVFNFFPSGEKSELFILQYFMLIWSSKNVIISRKWKVIKAVIGIALGDSESEINGRFLLFRVWTAQLLLSVGRNVFQTLPVLQESRVLAEASRVTRVAQAQANGHSCPTERHEATFGVRQTQRKRAQCQLQMTWADDQGQSVSKGRRSRQDWAVWAQTQDCPPRRRESVGCWTLPCDRSEVWRVSGGCESPEASACDSTGRLNEWTKDAKQYRRRHDGRD